MARIYDGGDLEADVELLESQLKIVMYRSNAWLARQGLSLFRHVQYA